MKEIYGEIEYKGKKYKLAFNLNVIDSIQAEYGTIGKWADLMDGAKGKTKGEPNAKAIIFGFREMLNEGIEIDNEDNGTDVKLFTLKQVGRLATEIGIDEIKNAVAKTISDSTESAEKNA